jgi:hypothetical protein
MKKYTLEGFKSSPNTLIKYFVLQERAELSMIDEAFEFYKKISTAKWKLTSKKKFTKRFLKDMKAYNSIT